MEVNHRDVLKWSDLDGEDSYSQLQLSWDLGIVVVVMEVNVAVDMH